MRGATPRPGGRSAPPWLQLDAGAPGLREPDRDHLLAGPGAVLPLADVLHLLTHELAGLSARSLALLARTPRPLARLPFGHRVVLL
jgi:hypothetical protein